MNINKAKIQEDIEAQRLGDKVWVDWESLEKCYALDSQRGIGIREQFVNFYELNGKGEPIYDTRYHAIITKAGKVKKNSAILSSY